MYTNEERIMLVSWYNLQMSLREVSAMFSATFPDRPIPSPSTISRLVSKFKREGCVKREHQNRRKPAAVVTGEKKLEIALHVEQNKNVSTRGLAEAVGISKTSVFRALKSERYHSFQYQNHQELVEGDTESRMEFCFRMFEMINENPGLRNKILFTDESTFMLHGEVHNQNFRYWSRSNLHLFHATRTQRPRKVNVWAGLIGTNILGPFFIQGNLDGENYLHMLQHRIVPALRALNLEGPLWYQHDGAPPHYTRAVRTYLDETFPNRWIGRGGEINWPARSPDLSPNDFFYWGFLKSKVYNGEIEDVGDLQRKIIAASQEITAQQLANTINNFYDRLTYCMNVNGGIFENLI